MRILMLKIRWSRDCLILNMGIYILVRHLHIETTPHTTRTPHTHHPHPHHPHPHHPHPTPRFCGNIRFHLGSESDIKTLTLQLDIQSCKYRFSEFQGINSCTEVDALKNVWRYHMLLELLPGSTLWIYPPRFCYRRPCPSQHPCPCILSLLRPCWCVKYLSMVLYWAGSYFCPVIHTTTSMACGAISSVVLRRLVTCFTAVDTLRLFKARVHITGLAQHLIWEQCFRMLANKWRQLNENIEYRWKRFVEKAQNKAPSTTMQYTSQHLDADKVWHSVVFFIAMYSVVVIL